MAEIQYPTEELLEKEILLKDVASASLIPKSKQQFDYEYVIKLLPKIKDFKQGKTVRFGTRDKKIFFNWLACLSEIISYYSSSLNKDNEDEF